MSESSIDRTSDALVCVLVVSVDDKELDISVAELVRVVMVAVYADVSVNVDSTTTVEQAP